MLAELAGLATLERAAAQAAAQSAADGSVRRLIAPYSYCYGWAQRQHINECLLVRIQTLHVSMQCKPPCRHGWASKTQWQAALHCQVVHSSAALYIHFKWFATHAFACQLALMWGQHCACHGCTFLAHVSHAFTPCTYPLARCMLCHVSCRLPLCTWVTVHSIMRECGTCSLACAGWM